MAKHLTQLHIENFRGIKNLSLNKFSHVNILAGVNNSGKTSILEVILSLAYTNDFKGLYEIAHSRSMGKLGLMEFKWLFNISSNKISIEAYVNNKNIIYSVELEEEVIYSDELPNIISDNIDIEDIEKNRLLRELKKPMSRSAFKRGAEKYPYENQEEIKNYTINYYTNGRNKCTTILNKFVANTHRPIYASKYKISSNLNFKCISLGVVDHLSGNITPNIASSIDNMERMTELLQIFDPHIKSIGLTMNEKYNFDTNLTIKHMIKGELPISVYGDGIKKIIALADSIMGAENGILLIDEIETSIHRSILKNSMDWLIRACKLYNVQIFLTTHSIEVCDTILETANDLSQSLYGEDNCVSMITLYNRNEDIVARTLDGKSALKMREDYDMELR